MNSLKKRVAYFVNNSGGFIITIDLAFLLIAAVAYYVLVGRLSIS
jgi:hypothetical protein